MFKEVPKVPNAPKKRLLTRHGHFNVEKTGFSSSKLWKADIYHYLVNLSWWKVVTLSFFYFIIMNSLFASLYWLDISHVGGTGPNATWVDAFFFSVQTMGTIGYGYYHPLGNYINGIVCFQSWVSFTSNAILAGIIITKFQRPARLRHTMKFSKVAVINKVTDTYHYEASAGWLPKGSYNKGEPTLSFRILNLRKRLLCMPDLRVMLLRREGRNYVIHELDYEINRQYGRPRADNMSKPHLQLPWTVVHPINEFSPLYGKTVDDFVSGDYEIICILDGVDELSSLNFQCRWSYVATEICWDHIFLPLLRRNNQTGNFEILYKNLSATAPINEAYSPLDEIDVNESTSLMSIEHW